MLSREAYLKNLDELTVLLCSVMDAIVRNIAGVSICLRSHERGVSNHDDVTKIAVEATVTSLSEFIDKVDAIIIADVRRGMPVRNYVITSDKLKKLAAEYDFIKIVSAFAPGYSGVMARHVLIELGTALNSNVDRLIPVLLGVAVLADAGMAEGVLDIEDISIKTTSLLREIIGTVKDATKIAFASACPELDAVAVYEDKIFVSLVAKGYTGNEANEHTMKRSEKRRTKVLNAIKARSVDAENKKMG